jgi:hypothetical protein
MASCLPSAGAFVPIKVVRPFGPKSGLNTCKGMGAPPGLTSLVSARAIWPICDGVQLLQSVDPSRNLAADLRDRGRLTRVAGPSGARQHAFQSRGSAGGRTGARNRRTSASSPTCTQLPISAPILLLRPPSEGDGHPSPSVPPPEGSPPSMLAISRIVSVPNHRLW